MDQRFSSWLLSSAESNTFSFSLFNCFGYKTFNAFKFITELSIISPDKRRAFLKKVYHPQIQFYISSVCNGYGFSLP
jgi:hypothetical protein